MNTQMLVVGLLALGAAACASDVGSDAANGKSPERDKVAVTESRLDEARTLLGYPLPDYCRSEAKWSGSFELAVSDLRDDFAPQEIWGTRVPGAENLHLEVQFDNTIPGNLITPEYESSFSWTNESPDGGPEYCVLAMPDPGVLCEYVASYPPGDINVSHVQSWDPVWMAPGIGHTVWGTCQLFDQPLSATTRVVIMGTTDVCDEPGC